VELTLPPLEELEAELSRRKLLWRVNPDHWTDGYKVDYDTPYNGGASPWAGATWKANPQRLARESQADITGYGGQAGGGKTDLPLGLAHQEHLKSIIFRREYPQLKGIEERSREMFGHLGEYNGTDKLWRIRFGTNPLTGEAQMRLIEFGAVQFYDDVMKYMGRPHDLIGFDQVETFQEAQVRFLLGWLRTDVEGQRVRAIMTLNPPTTAEGRWVIKFFAPWLDKKYEGKRAKDGELRYYATLPDGQEIECLDGTPFEATNPRTGYKETIRPLSRTFFRASVRDNPTYVRTGYERVLQSLPEPLRSMMLYGDFDAGVTDDPWQVIKTDWFQKALDRGKALKAQRLGVRPTSSMTQLGVDVARGGADNTVLTPRYDHVLWTPAKKPGIMTPDGPSVVAFMSEQPCSPTTVCCIDVIGVGSSPVDFARLSFKVIPMNGTERDKDARTKGPRPGEKGALGFKNNHSMWIWRLREDLDPSSGIELAIVTETEADGQELLAQACAYKWELTSQGIKIETKDEIIASKRLKRSPDEFESLVYSHARPTLAGQGLLDFFEQQVAAMKEQSAANDAKQPVQAVA